jgi:hypothetical protein
MKTSIFHLYLSSILLILSQAGWAQFSIDAGPDLVICEGDTTNLSGAILTPSAGHSSTYTFKWTCNFKIGSIDLNESHFLDNPSVLHPNLFHVNTTGKDITLYLTVTDNSGNSKQDSISVSFSVFAITLEDKFKHIVQGDSVELYTSISNLNSTNLTYEWTPNYRLSDNTLEKPFASPDTTTFYYLTVTDEFGCSSKHPDVFKVFVYEMSVDDISENQFKIIKQAEGFSIISDIEIKNTVRLSNIQGQVLFQKEERSRNINIPMESYAKGIYIIQIGGKSKKVIW